LGPEGKRNLAQWRARGYPPRGGLGGLRGEAEGVERESCNGGKKKNCYKRRELRRAEHSKKNMKEERTSLFPSGRGNGAWGKSPAANGGGKWAGSAIRQGKEKGTHREKGIGVTEKRVDIKRCREGGNDFQKRKRKPEKPEM